LHEKYIVQDKTHKKERKRIFAKLKEAFQTVNWVTFRSDLESPILGSLYRSDAGWGCMIRTGQMLLLQALQRHVFDDNFRRDYLRRSDYMQEYLNLLRLFQDNGSGEDFAFSLHNVAEEGAKLGRKPGDWYGPQAIMLVLKRLNKRYRPVAEFEMVVAKEGNIYLDKLERKLATNN
jgi:cysteine protease ATG4